MGQKTVRKLAFMTKNMKLLKKTWVKNNIFKSTIWVFWQNVCANA